MVPRASFSQTEIYKQSLKLAETSYQEKEADFKARLHRLQKEVDDVTQSKEREATAFEQKMVVLLFYISSNFTKGLYSLDDIIFLLRCNCRAVKRSG